MSPGWTTPETAAEVIDDLLALLMSGYTVELVPMDLIGPDRAACRVTHQHGEAIAPSEIRIGSLRELADGLRQLRSTALGSNDEPAGESTTGSNRTAAELPLGLMAAMMGMGEAPGLTGETNAGRSVQPADPVAMAAAIATAIRPARVTTDDPPPGSDVDPETDPDGAPSRQEPR